MTTDTRYNTCGYGGGTIPETTKKFEHIFELS